MDPPPNITLSTATNTNSSEQVTPPAPDNRPPGGTRRSGVKTPRRVQWMADEREGSPSTRALDEHGLDVRPLIAFFCSRLA